MRTFQWRVKILFGVLLATTACLGADTVSSDASRFPAVLFRLQINLAVNGVTATSGTAATRQATVDLERRGFNGNISLRLDSLPTGLVASFASTRLAYPTQSTTLTIQIPATMPAGDYRIVMRATAPFVKPVTEVIVVHVLNPPGS